MGKILIVHPIEGQEHKTAELVRHIRATGSGNVEEIDPHARPTHVRRMWATIAPMGSPNGFPMPIVPGDLVCVDVPPNCTIHDVDARRLSRILSLAEQIAARWWRDQKSVNSALLDELAGLFPEET